MEFIEIESGIGSTSEVSDFIKENTRITFQFGFDLTIRGTRDGKKILATRWTARPTRNNIRTFEMYSNKDYETCGKYDASDKYKINEILDKSREKFNNYIKEEINDGKIRNFDFRYFPEDYRLDLLRRMSQYLESHK
ncbi:hypothetical protein [Draconibacterium halophilum]|uniref:Uncharacterized protein n=1 Tax=Draconibacterium halophilum TaxID=2706887 RepID=A0A6C0RG47_9BACT|nr:hypothetical protein [Draconibacterium halophilum]QIA08802.1 hypothetical protein G0Q07_14215 [Draconibacterium halophilum]